MQVTPMAAARMANEGDSRGVVTVRSAVLTGNWNA